MNAFHKQYIKHSTSHHHRTTAIRDHKGNLTRKHCGEEAPQDATHTKGSKQVNYRIRENVKNTRFRKSDFLDLKWSNNNISEHEIPKIGIS